MENQGALLIIHIPATVRYPHIWGQTEMFFLHSKAHGHTGVIPRQLSMSWRTTPKGQRMSYRHLFEVTEEEVGAPGTHHLAQRRARSRRELQRWEVGFVKSWPSFCWSASQRVRSLSNNYARGLTLLDPTETSSLCGASRTNSRVTDGKECLDWMRAWEDGKNQNQTHRSFENKTLILPPEMVSGGIKTRRDAERVFVLPAGLWVGKYHQVTAVARYQAQSRLGRRYSIIQTNLKQSSYAYFAEVAGAWKFGSHCVGYHWQEFVFLYYDVHWQRFHFKYRHSDFLNPVTCGAFRCRETANMSRGLADVVSAGLCRAMVGIPLAV
ncbi:hypothetical protein K438DRAFT_1757893 [Mycena galopus ATCC 62051]|nr:hypothetical protein K438DRAFT_1757893 [Mycena galopus ATCC 62051]